MSSDVALSLGGLLYRFSAEGFPLWQDLEDAYRPFVLQRLPSPVPADSVSVRLSVSASPSSDGQPIFRSSASWTLLAEGERRAFLFQRPGEEPLYVARFRPGDPEVFLVCSTRLLETREGGVFLRSPFHYPLDQVVSMYLLNGRGFTVHAAGALVGGRGVLFAGVSGAGKTTISRLAGGRRGWEALSDDRVIVRLDRGPATVYGTPWPGEGNVAESRSGALAWLLFLAHGESNAVDRLEPGEALPRLLQTVSIPWYDREHLGSALDACGRLVRAVPAALLTFRPDDGAVDAVEQVLGSGIPLA